MMTLEQIKIQRGDVLLIILLRQGQPSAPAMAGGGTSSQTNECSSRHKNIQSPVAANLAEFHTA